MPVLLNSENNVVYPTVDVETLVNEVRERLCLKSREKLCSQRSAPYHISRSSQPKTKHYSSPEMCVYRCKQKSQSSYLTCPYGKYMSSNLRDNQTFDNPRALLEKLISEQSLIQEAVRRLQSQAAPPVKKFFAFVDDDSDEKYSNKVPLFSEPGDDCLSTIK